MDKYKERAYREKVKIILKECIRGNYTPREAHRALSGLDRKYLYHSRRDGSFNVSPLFQTPRRHILIDERGHKD